MNPTALLPPPLAPASVPVDPTSLEDLLGKQMQLASGLQTFLSENAPMVEAGQPVSIRDYRDLLAATNSMLSLSHRTEEALRTIETYKKFVDLILNFLRARSDSLGTDLVAELQAAAKALGVDPTTQSLAR